MSDLLKDARFNETSTAITFELFDYQFRYPKVGAGLIRKRRKAGMIFKSDDDEKIDAFMQGFIVKIGDEDFIISNDFTLDDLYAKLPEVKDGEAVQFSMIEQLPTVAAAAVMGKEVFTLAMEKAKK